MTWTLITDNRCLTIIVKKLQKYYSNDPFLYYLLTNAQHIASNLKSAQDFLRETR